MNASGDPHRGSPVRLAWRDQAACPTWDQDNAGHGGGDWATYPKLACAGSTGQMILVPPGQTGSGRAYEGDSVYVGVEGEISVAVGHDTYTIGARDILRISAETIHSFVNTGLDHALVFLTIGRPVGRDPGNPVSFMDWASNRSGFAWKAPLCERAGLQRHSGPYIYSATLAGHMVRLSPGQGSPWHGVPADLLFVSMNGDVQFSAAGAVWPLERRDILMIPANTPYLYVNVGLSDAVFFDISEKRPPGALNTYYASDPGWPVRSDVPLLDTAY